MDNVFLSELILKVSGRISDEDAGKGISISGINSLQEATSDQISFFLGDAKYSSFFLSTSAAVVLVPRDFQAPKNCNSLLIFVDNPSFAFSLITDLFLETQKKENEISLQSFIHPSASFDRKKISLGAFSSIGKGVKIGENCVIGAGTIIEDWVQIGENCKIDNNITIHSRCVLGDNVSLSSGVIIGADGFGFDRVNGKHQKNTHIGIVELQDEVDIGANTTIDRARFGKTLIGRGTKIDNLVMIAHNVHIGERCLLAGKTAIAGSAIIGNDVILAGRTSVAGHIKIADEAIILSGTVVYQDLKQGVYLGYPAKDAALERRIQAVLKKLPSVWHKILKLIKD